MTTKLHEVLAAEKTKNAAWTKLYDETLKKLGNEHFFSGQSKRLKMIEDSPANAALEAAAAEDRVVPTNVFDTLDYALGIFAEAEDLQLSKNATNTHAFAAVEFPGFPPTSLPVDELLGLETRLGKIRQLFIDMPTLDATKNWTFDHQLGAWVAPPESTTKTEKVMIPVILAPATDKHPAQVKESTRDNVVGSFTLVKRSGAVTAVQKSEAIKQIDAILVAVKQARMRANETEVIQMKIGAEIVKLLLAPLKN
jgi:hypothetical protein